MRAFDFHVHVPRREELQPVDVEMSLRSTFSVKSMPSTTDMAALYRSLGVRAAIFSVDTQANTGEIPDGNDYVAAIANDYDDVFVGFASVDPNIGLAAVQELRRAVRDLGLKGLKLHPIHQAFYPNDRNLDPLWQACVELNIPVLLHSGYAAAGGGMPGGRGLRLDHGRPIPYIDDLAARFSELRIVMAHPAWPWISEQLAVLRHKPNVYMDLSGWSPKRFPPELVAELGRSLQDRALFGSDFPYIAPDRWLEAFETLGLGDEVVEKVTKRNALSLLGIAP